MDAAWRDGAILVLSLQHLSTKKPELSEKEIIKGCLNKQAKAQKAFVMAYSGYLFTVARRYMPDSESAKDILQDAFIKIFNKFHQFDQNKGTLKAWTSRIVANEALSRRRKFLDAYKLTDHEAVVIEVQPKAISQLNEEDILSIIRDLPEPLRLVFNLYEIEGYSHKEIGEMLRIKESTSRSSLARSKKLLRKRISEQETNKRWITTT